MAWESHEHRHQTFRLTGNVGGCISKKKSFTNLFSSKSRRQSNAQLKPLSTQPPVTPTVPERFLRTSPDASRTSSAELGLSNDYAGMSKEQHSPASIHLGQPSAELGNPRTHQHDGFIGPSKGNEPAPVASSNRTETKENDASDEIREERHNMHKLHKSPTFPSLHRELHDALQTSDSLPDPRLRDLSAARQKTKMDPSDAGVSIRSKTAVGEDLEENGTAWLHESVEVLPAGCRRNIFNHPRPQYKTYQNEIRTSFRSALTATSSIINAPSSRRSSVITRRTSLSDSTVETSGSLGSKGVGMTVDDAIDLYVAGFADDNIFQGSSDQDSSIYEEMCRSKRIAQAISESMGSGELPAERPLISASRNSSNIVSSAALRDLPTNTSSDFPTSTRDRYGFLKASHHFTFEEYDRWNLNYSLAEERRDAKWHSYMRESKLSSAMPTEFPHRSAKTQRFVRKGIPPSWRGAAWFYYAGGQYHLDRQPHAYADLLARSGTSELSDIDKEVIERDLHRTFPDNVHFKPEHSPAFSITEESPLLSSLRHVLRAFSLHSPMIGYCQSLNFIAGLLLLFLSEEKAFWMLHVITTEYLPGTHEISLEGANIDLWVLMIALKESLPGIWAKVASGDDATGSLGTSLPPISLCTTSWFMSLFIGTLPIESVLRVWDVLFYEGSRTLFRVALAIFKVGQQRIQSINDSMEMFQVVQSLPRGMLDVGSLLDAAFRRGGVSQDWVEKKRGERRRWYASERARIGGQLAAVAERSTSTARANSLWKRRRK